MNFLNKLERKYGKYAVRNLPAIIIALYAAGYLISVGMPELLYYLTLRPDLILKGQVWRIVSWILVPPGSLDIFTLIMLYFYFSIGKTLERTWGAFRFNVYIFSGILFKLTGAGEYVSYAMISKWGMEALGSISDLNSLPLRIQETVPSVPHEVEKIFEATSGHLLTVWGILLAFILVFVVIGNLMLHTVSKDTR